MEADDPVAVVKPIGRSRLVDSVVDQLRNRILTGALPPGQTLRQIELSERLGISRTPLREAFRILEHEGFVRSSNGNKTLEVVDLGIPDMIEYYEIREVIDGLAARLAAQREQDPSDLEDLSDILDQMNVAPDFAHRATLHADFHAGIAELSGNRHVIAQLPMIRLTAQMLSRKLASLAGAESPVTPELLEEGEHDHREILAAIAAHDAPGAESKARRHIRKTLRSQLLRPGEPTR
jgi:GntR family transcriptional regulator of vanillate catabolism